ncbi:MAG: VWA domain-containing protein [Chloroflexi bacterium]|nr:VWA domain-containing protein [Chloroflexota bacterium]
MAGEVAVQCTLNKEAVPVLNTQQLAYAYIEIKPTGAMAAVRMPLNLCLALDHSGSMSGAKIRNVREAVKLIIEQLQPQDVVSIVLFDDKVDVIAPSQMVQNADALKTQIDKIRDRGGTTMSLGLSASIREVQKQLSPNRLNRILLLTDGQTYGDEDKCRQLATDAAVQGISIMAFGLGDEWNEVLLDDLAHHGGVESDHIRQPSEIMAIFKQQINRMQATVVTNTELILRLVGGVTPRNVWRVIPQISNLGYRALTERDVQVPLGQLEKDTGQALLVELLMPVRPAGRYRVAQAEVSYDVPSNQVHGERVRTDVLVEYTLDQQRAQQVNPDIMNLAEKVTAFRLQTQALDEARAGNLINATQKLRRAATRLLELGEADLAGAAQIEADRLERGEGLSSAGTKKLTYGTRKLTQRLDLPQEEPKGKVD